MKRNGILLLAFASLGLIVSNSAGQPRPVFIKPSQQWAGVIRDEALKGALAANGPIVDEEAWTSLWKAWRPDEDVPAVDFAESIVYAGTVPGPNRTIFAAAVTAEGELTITLGGTKIGGPGFGYVLAVLPREGIKTYRGKPLPAAAEAGEYVHVEMRGKLATGLVAIGGETTGAAIKADGITFELDFGGKNELTEKAEAANGQVAKVAGRLERRAGVEVKERWILHVQSLEASERSKNAD
jgi:hypothetical protein